ncbi:MAG: flippase [Patescibacteria group bacterium]|jgi:O-antigen/teichoic acid export membrane protein
MAEGRVAKNTAYLLSASVGQKILAFIYFTIVARSVGVEGTGRYFVAVSFTTIFSIFVDLGLANVLVREVAKVPENAQKLLANVLGLKAVLGVLTVAAVLLVSRLIGYPAETRLLITVAAGVMVLDSIHLVLYAVMRGFQNLRYEAIGVVTGQAVIITTGIVFVLLKLPLVSLVIALLCGSIWNVAWAAWILNRQFGVKPILRFDEAVIRFFGQVALPFAFAGIFSRVYSYIDSVMLSRLVSEEAVGYYSVGYKLTFAFQFLPMAFAAAIYPAMSEYYVKDRAKLAAVFMTAIKYLLLVVVPLTVGTFVLAGPIIHLVYGPAYDKSVLPLQILIFSLVFAFLYWPCGSLLNACDRQSQNTTVMGVTMIGNIILNVFLIPRFEAVGAAWSALIGNAALFGLAFYFASRVVVIDKQRLLSIIGRIAIAGAAMGIIVELLDGAASLAFMVPLGALVYAALVFQLRIITWTEAKNIMNLFLRRGRGGVSDIVS